jgi:hypothetical protein
VANIKTRKIAPPEPLMNRITMEPIRKIDARNKFAIPRIKKIRKLKRSSIIYLCREGSVGHLKLAAQNKNGDHAIPAESPSFHVTA